MRFLTNELQIHNSPHLRCNNWVCRCGSPDTALGAQEMHPGFEPAPNRVKHSLLRDISFSCLQELMPVCGAPFWAWGVAACAGSWGHWGKGSTVWFCSSKGMIKNSPGILLQGLCLLHYLLWVIQNAIPLSCCEIPSLQRLILWYLSSMTFFSP